MVGTRQGWGSILRGAWLNARTAAIVFIATVLLAIVIALLMPAKYRSEARLLTLPADYYEVSGRGSENAGNAEQFKPEELANVEIQLLSSEDLQREVIAQSGSADDTANAHALDDARKALARNLTISRVDGANVIELGLTARTPQEAQQRLDKLLEIYFETRARILTSGRTAMIAQQRDAAEKELAAANTALRSFQARNGIVDIDGQVSGAIAVDTALRQELAATKAGLSETLGNSSRLRGSSSSVPRTVEIYRDDTEATKAIADMQSEILTLEAKRADLEGRYMAGSPLIAQVDKQIAGLRTAIGKHSGELREARRTGRNTYYDAANDRIIQSDAAASGQAAKLNSLNAELSASQLRLDNLNQIAEIVSGLQTRRDVAAERFRGLSTQLEETRSRELEATTGSTNVRVIQQPSLPDGRSNGPLLLIAGGILAGLMLAAATLFVLIVRRDNYLGDEVKDSLGLPIVLDLTTPFSSTTPPAARPAGGGQRGRIMALVAADAGSYGNELTELANRLEARSGQSVATVMFEDEAYQLPDGGAGELIAKRSGRQRIKVGSVAWSIDRTGEQLLDRLRQSYGWTILLVPPAIGETRDLRILRAAGPIDDVFVVVRTQTTPRSATEDLLALLRKGNAAIRGVVLTGRRRDWPKFIRKFD